MYTNKDYFEVVVVFYDNTCLKEFYLIKNLVYVYKDELKKVGIKSVDHVIALIDLCDKRNDHLNSNSISNRNAINKCSGFAGFALMNLEDKHVCQNLQDTLKRFYINIKGKNPMTNIIYKPYVGFFTEKNKLQFSKELPQNNLITS